MTHYFTLHYQHEGCLRVRQLSDLFSSPTQTYSVRTVARLEGPNVLHCFHWRDGDPSTLEELGQDLGVCAVTDSEPEDPEDLDGGDVSFALVYHADREVLNELIRRVFAAELRTDGEISSVFQEVT